MTAVNVTSSGPAARFLAQVTSQLQPSRLLPRVGGSAQRLTQRHLRRLDRERPNQLGGRRTNFYGKAARGTFFTVAPEGVVVTVGQQGMRQRFAGGVITPVKARFLTIPATAEAHGKRAGEFSDLKFAVIPGQGPALVRASDQFKSVGAKRKDGTRRQKQVSSAGDVIFWLRKRVTQRPDPTVIPDAAAYGTAIANDLATWLNTLAARAAASPSATT
ncbi:MAG: hypothetical protein RJB26_1815 [Pseudomonadota bacterium]|jgi:hypothetical protein